MNSEVLKQDLNKIDYEAYKLYAELIYNNKVEFYTEVLDNLESLDSDDEIAIELIDTGIMYDLPFGEFRDSLGNLIEVYVVYIDSKGLIYVINESEDFRGLIRFNDIVNIVDRLDLIGSIERYFNK